MLLRDHPLSPYSANYQMHDIDRRRRNSRAREIIEELAHTRQEKLKLDLSLKRVSMFP